MSSEAASRSSSAVGACGVAGWSAEGVVMVGLFGAGSREGVGVDATTVIDQESEGGERLADAPGLAETSTRAVGIVAAVDFRDAAEHAA